MKKKLLTISIGLVMVMSVNITVFTGELTPPIEGGGTKISNYIEIPDDVIIQQTKETASNCTE